MYTGLCTSKVDGKPTCFFGIESEDLVDLKQGTVLE